MTTDQLDDIKLFSLLPRRPDISAEQFHKHWSTVHVDLALRIRRMTRYVQFHVSGAALPGFARSSYDGVAECWFGDVAAFRGLADDPDFTEHAGRDDQYFIDMGGRAAVVTQQSVIRAGLGFDDDAPMAKDLIFLKKSPGLTRDEFDRWSEEELDRIVVEDVPSLARYVRCSALADNVTGTAQPFASVLELWWHADAARESSAGGLLRLSESLADLHVILHESLSLVGTELRIVWPHR